MRRVTLLAVLGLWLPTLLTVRAQNTFSIEATPAILAAAGGNVTLTVKLNYQSSVSAISVKVTAPSSDWTYTGTSGANVPQIVPKTGDTGATGDGFGFLFFTIPPGAATYGFSLKYPAKLTAPQVFQASASLSSTNGSPTVLQASVTIAPTPVAPTISTQPVDTTLTVGSPLTFTVIATGTAPFTYQWRRNGAAITGASNGTFSIPAVQLTDAASYDVIVSNASGSVTSRTAKLVTLINPVAPVFETQPESSATSSSGAVSFSVVASGTPTPTYQWQRLPAGASTWATLANTTTYAGVTTATLVLRATTNAMNGDRFRCIATNSAGNKTSNEAVLTITIPTPSTVVTPVNAVVTPINPATPTKTETPLNSETLVQSSTRLTNLSVRATAGSGDQSLIVGFVIGGAGTKQILVRGIGPALAQFGVGGSLADPSLSLFNSAGSRIGSNDNWGGSSTLSRSFSSVGAFSLPTSSRDAAISMALPASACSAQITGVGGATGVSLAEVYDADDLTANAHFVNLSARNYVGSGDALLVVGFVITGNTSNTVLIRGIGPTLTKFGVGGTLANPQLKLFNQQGQAIEENDDWAGTTKLSTAFEQNGAFPLSPDSKDAALLVTLQPGVYTAQVSGVANSTGVALIEVYEVR